MFRISKIKQFSKFLETFPEITSIPSAAVFKFSKVLVSEWKAPQVLATILHPCCLSSKHKRPESRPSCCFLSLFFIKNLLVRSMPTKSTVELDGLGRS